MNIRTEDVGDIIFLNFLFMSCWHLIVLIFSIYLSPSFFNPERSIYKIRKWERNGSFYVNTLKIKKWKDKLPQYVTKNGFSKKSLNCKLNKDYVEKFIVETCRAEWNHLWCCMYFVISFVINPFFYAIIFSIISIVINIPFLFIQRFNRIRLYKFIKHSNFSISSAVNN